MKRSLIQTKIYYKCFSLSLKRNHSKTFKSSSFKKNFFPVCMLLIQLASMKVFVPFDGWNIFLFVPAYRFKLITSLIEMLELPNFVHVTYQQCYLSHMIKFCWRGYGHKLRRHSLYFKIF